MSHLKNTAAVAAGTLAAGIGYASLIERNAFALREFTMPVLSPGSTPLRVLPEPAMPAPEMRACREEAMVVR